MGYCSYCGNWVDEGSICSHCGGAGGSRSHDDAEEDKIPRYISRYEYCRWQGRECSKRGDHLTAIGFYNDAFEATRRIQEKCNMLSAIAGEYEMMGDYASAEEYWNRCLETALDDPYDSLYMYIARKGDFLYRIGRYGEAIVTYQKSLKALKDTGNGQFSLKYYARVTHFLIDSYERLGDENRKEEYHNELKREIGSYIQSKGGGDEIKANHLSQVAWELYRDEWLIGEALILIDSAIELHPNCPAYKYFQKAKILQGGFQYEEALKYYDIALAKDELNETFLKNRVQCKAECIKSKLKVKVIVRNVTHQHLDLINKALKILPEDCNHGPYLDVKADILSQLGEPVKAKICRALAAKDYDEVDKVDKQLKKLKSGGTYINITGIHYYQGFAPFKEGTVFDLIREPDNPHDRDAIRVEINGETVGYVANSKYTLIKEVSSATDIKNTNSTHVEVQFILFREWVIAKLI